jgi:hypothetical protein
MLQKWTLLGKVPPLTKGRYPALAETCIIFWLTDALEYSTPTTVKHDIHIPALLSPGKESYIEPFRWEQRLYTLALIDKTRKYSNINVMSQTMGGEYWEIPNLKALLQCMETCLGVPQRHPVLLLVPNFYSGNL